MEDMAEQEEAGWVVGEESAVGLAEDWAAATGLATAVKVAVEALAAADVAAVAEVVVAQAQQAPVTDTLSISVHRR